MGDKLSLILSDIIDSFTETSLLIITSATEQ